MLIENFEDAKVWQKAQELAVTVYGVFKNIRDFGFKDQIQRSAVSVSNNIAEGFERQTNKELINFLYIAKGSCGETRSMFHLAVNLGYINKVEFDRLYSLCISTSKLLGAFIKACR